MGLEGKMGSCLTNTESLVSKKEKFWRSVDQQCEIT